MGGSGIIRFSGQAPSRELSIDDCLKKLGAVLVGDSAVVTHQASGRALAEIPVEVILSWAERVTWEWVPGWQGLIGEEDEYFSVPVWPEMREMLESHRPSADRLVELQLAVAKEGRLLRPYLEAGDPGPQVLEVVDPLVQRDLPLLGVAQQVLRPLPGQVWRGPKEVQVETSMPILVPRSTGVILAMRIETRSFLDAKVWQDGGRAIPAFVRKGWQDSPWDVLDAVRKSLPGVVPVHSTLNPRLPSLPGWAEKYVH